MKLQGEPDPSHRYNSILHLAWEPAPSMYHLQELVLQWMVFAEVFLISSRCVPDKPAIGKRLSQFMRKVCNLSIIIDGSWYWDIPYLFIVSVEKLTLDWIVSGCGDQN